MAKKNDNRRDDETQITVYMPTWLVKRIDETAAKEHRQRSPQIVALVEEAYQCRDEEMAEAR